MKDYTTARQIILTISYLKKGKWEDIYAHIKNQVPLTKEEKAEAEANTKSNYVTIVDEDYPSCLKDIYKPPFVLYYYGNLALTEAKYRLTAVGSRKPSIYQNDTCYRLIQEVEEKMNHEVVIVSGMAKGSDSTMMKAAMNVNAPVISIIGSGIDNPYPADNDGIYDYCKSGKGLVLSEYPLNEKAASQNFLFRNRLLAAFSPSLFVGSGKRRSGTNNSVYWASSFNRNVLCLPCNVNLDDPELTNELIKQGADPILCSDDLKAEIIQTAKANEKK